MKSLVNKTITANIAKIICTTVVLINLYGCVFMHYKNLPLFLQKLLDEL